MGIANDDNGTLIDEDGQVYGVRQDDNRPHVLAYGKTGDATYQVPRLDASTHNTKTITDAHSRIHDGVSFHVGYSVTTANSDDDVTAIMFQTPNTTKWAHLTATFTSSGAAEAIILEAPTLADSGDGTDKAALNRDRNSATASTVQSLEDAPTVGSVTTMNETEWTAVGVSAGTELAHEFLAGSTGPKAVGGTERGTQEWILKQNTIYVFYLQNTGASANAHSISLDWHETTNLTA